MKDFEKIEAIARAEAIYWMRRNPQPKRSAEFKKGAVFAFDYITRHIEKIKAGQI